MPRRAMPGLYATVLTPMHYCVTLNKTFLKINSVILVALNKRNIIKRRRPNNCCVNVPCLWKQTEKYSFGCVFMLQQTGFN